MATFEEKLSEALGSVSEGEYEDYEIKENLYYHSNDEFWLELLKDLNGFDGYDESGSVIVLAKTLEIIKNRVDKLTKETVGGGMEFKTIADCVWGKQNNLDTELFIDGEAVALLHMDNDQFYVMPRIRNSASRDEDSVKNGHSGAVYDRDSLLIPSDGCDPYEWMKSATTELVFVKKDGFWTATTRKMAGLK